MKTCSVCLQTKPYEEFFFNHTCKDNHNPWCKSCTKIYQKERREKLRAGKPRKQWTRVFYIQRPKIPNPPDPAHAIEIQRGVFKETFE